MYVSSSRPAVNLWKMNTMLETINEHPPSSAHPMAHMSTSAPTSPHSLSASTSTSLAAVSTSALDDYSAVDAKVPTRPDPAIPPLTSASKSSYRRRSSYGIDDDTARMSPHQQPTATSLNSREISVPPSPPPRRVEDSTNQRLLTSFRQRRQEMLHAGRYEGSEDSDLHLHGNRDTAIPVYTQVTYPSLTTCSLMIYP